MERSSPLAAMQPPCLLGPWAFAPDPPALARPSFADRPVFGPNSFNFRDLSMKPPVGPADYFTLKPVRGSSPTASLAADLSQNFHIDKSPKLVTPRRSLFTSTLFGALDAGELMTTPPLPSSSPGPGLDAMDISPLPHKPAFSLVTRVDIPAPASDASPTETCGKAAAAAAAAGASLAPPAMLARDLLAPERRKPAFPRPSVARLKGNSTNSVSLKTCRPEAQLPPFRFGGPSKMATSMTFGECFVDSPPHDRKTVAGAAPSVAPTAHARPKPPFPTMSTGVRNGSPLGGHHVRKPSVPAPRPRKLFRRSLSMFQHPDDVMREESPFAGSTANLPPVMDVDEPHPLLLPHFLPPDQPDSLPRISRDTLIDVLDGKYAGAYEQSLIVDCRFEYEYDGGHIEGALNFNDKELLASKLFEVKTPPRTLLIFHCEYSAHRAPMMAKFIRGQDRTINDFRYPELTYPEVYILEGGYSSFFVAHRSRCFPPNYVEMHSKEHVGTCEREMGKLRHRKKLSRAQTFAFGQHPHPVDDSPTGPGRHSIDAMMDSPVPDEHRRAHARRMASY